MTSFCHGKFFVSNRSDKEDVVEDAKKRVLEAKIRLAARLYYNANGDKEEQLIVLLELSNQFLSYEGTQEQLNNLLNEK